MWNFSWVVPGAVAGMGRPAPEDLEGLRRHGITGLVSVTETPVFPAAPPGMRVLHVPVQDMAAPTQEQLAAAVKFLDEVVSGGGKAAVHCGAGFGRTGTVLAAWLIARGKSAEEALKTVRALRPGSVETREQEEAVRAFGKSRRPASPAKKPPAAGKAAAKPKRRGKGGR